jgi:hypothetical protein
VNLDINTPKGAITLQQELRLAEIIKLRWPGSCYLHTPKDTMAAVDAILHKDEVIKAVGQASCRNNTLGDFQTTFKNEWLLTYEKMIKGRDIALGLWVEYWGLLYLVPEDILIRVRMFTPLGGWQVPFRIAKTETQATCNGGTAIRDNAFINIQRADIIKGAEYRP